MSTVVVVGNIGKRSEFMVEYPPVTVAEAELLFRDSDLAMVKRMAQTIIGLNKELNVVQEKKKGAATR